MYWLIIPVLAAIWDWKTGEIPDWITVPGIVLALFYSLLLNKDILVPLMSFGIFGYLLYRYGIVGGGDVLLTMAVIPFLEDSPINILVLPFFVLFSAIVLTSSAYGLITQIRKRNYVNLIPLFFLPFGLSLLYGIVLFSRIDRKFFVKEVTVEELKEEDIIAEPIEGFGKRVIERGDKEKLKSLGVTKVRVFTNLPRMGPFLLISMLISMNPHLFVYLLLTVPVLGPFHVS